MYGRVNFNFKYPFLYLLITLIAGILGSKYVSLPVYSYYAALLLILLFRKLFKTVTDFLLLFALFCIGLNLPTPVTISAQENVIYPIHCRCAEKLSHHNYIISIKNQKFYLNHIYTDTTYSVGDSLHFYATFKVYKDHVNPGEFSYAHYLKQKDVYYQLIPYSVIRQQGSSRDLFSVFNNLRDQLMNKTSRLTQDSTCRMLINALCLGYRNDLDSDLQNLFITTGTVHLLSVSGLHTGAVYLLFLLIWRHIGFRGKKAELIILPLLWCYTCLTGLSPSVVRASTILTFIMIGKAFTRTYTPVNSLAASAFFTLLINPSTLYSLSFLLSYSAYAGILIFYPILYRLPGTLPPFVSKLYACFCLTLSAQLPTLPISAFYFHTINITGFLANIIAVPLATLLLYCSAICIILPFLISQYLFHISEILHSLLLRFLQLFVHFSVNITNLYPSPLIIISIYGIAIFTGLFIFQRKIHWLYANGITLMLLFAYLAIQNLHLSNKREVMIFHYYKQSIILLNDRGYYLYLKNTYPEIKTLSYVYKNKLKALPTGYGILESDLLWEAPSLHFQADTILILENLHPCYDPCTILIVTDNITPQQAFQAPVTSQIPSIIVTDGSNNKYTTQKWHKFCKEYNIIFRNTFENGPVCFPLK